MIPLATGAALKTAMALTAATAGAVMFTGTAQAATPAPATATTATTATTAAALPQQASEFPLWDPHGRAFRVRFRTYGECVFFANHDRNPRTHGWDCRRGGDRNFPWEYWY